MISAETLGGGAQHDRLDRAPEIEGAGQDQVAHAFLAGVASPVRFDSSLAVWPLRISASTGTARRA